MRAELALMIGIVCFCCWCAYILIRMTYSASALAASSGAEPPPIGGPVMQLASGGANAPLGFRRPANSSSNLALKSSYGSLTSRQQEWRPIGANQAGSSRRTDQVSSWQEPARSSVRDWRLGAPLEQASSYPAATRMTNNRIPQWRRRLDEVGPVENQQPVIMALPAIRRGATNRQLQRQHRPTHGHEPEEESGSSPASVSRRRSHLLDDESQHKEGPDTALDADIEDTEEQDPETELDERQSSFSEIQTEASERDRYGRPIITHRRHLINGRPVGSSGSLHYPTRGNTRKGIRQREFEALVNSIEGARADGDERTEEVYDETAGHSFKPSTVSRKSVVVAGDETRHKPKDSHQHRMTHSVSAQRWNDDSAPLLKSHHDPELLLLEGPAEDDGEEESRPSSSLIDPSTGSPPPEPKLRHTDGKSQATGSRGATWKLDAPRSRPSIRKTVTDD